MSDGWRNWSRLAEAEPTRLGMPGDAEAVAAEVIAARDAGGRPHWGKLHSLDAAAPAERYDRLAAVRDRLDPDRVFANDHLDLVLGA